MDLHRKPPPAHRLSRFPVHPPKRLASTAALDPSLRRTTTSIFPKTRRVTLLSSNLSEETATIYAALVAEWKAKGRLSRTSWLATPPVAREKFNEFLLHQPYLPKAAE